MFLANAAARPCDASTQVLSSMGSILSSGYVLSIPSGQFSVDTLTLCNRGMQTVYETRRARLGMLREQYKSWAALNEALGWERTSARLSQIFNQTERKERGTTYEMGDPTAREIEVKLSLQLGWMDTPPGTEYAPTDERIRRVIKVMEGMPEWQVQQALKIIDTIAEPADKGNGTLG